MSNPLPLPERLESAFAHPYRGVVGLVDDLLMAALQQDIRLGWQAGRCDVSFPGGSNDRIEVQLGKPVFRAALARIAALCNERRPGSVSPYGGQGEIAIEAEPSRVIRAIFVNTPETLSLELACVPSEVVSLIGLSPSESSH